MSFTGQNKLAAQQQLFTNTLNKEKDLTWDFRAEGYLWQPSVIIIIAVTIWLDAYFTLFLGNISYYF